MNNIVQALLSWAADAAYHTCEHSVNVVSQKDAFQPVEPEALKKLKKIQ